jgi:hypothetical protein
MAIVETKIVIRTDTSIPFFSQTENPARLDSTEAIALALSPHTILTDTSTYLKSTNASGSHVVERMYSDDLLTQTSKSTFDSLETFSTVETCIGIALDHAYSVYAQDNGFTHPATGQYSLTGIDAPFSCTTTYTYSSNILDTYTLFDSFIDVIESSDKLTSFTNTGTQLIAVHTYNNAADFIETHWRDFMFVSSLYNSGVTRTIEYALVGSDA